MAAIRLLVGLTLMGLAATAGSAEAQPPPAAPNVLVVMTDDQPYGAQTKMPFLESVKDEFTDFTQAHDNNALCCPARATFLSGEYSHHTGVELNNGAPFDASTTLATRFDQAGYETGLFGKYLNGYPWDSGEFVPDGWDSWTAFTAGFEIGAAYYDYELNVDGQIESYGDAPEDYSTDVLAGRLDDFIADADAPFFAMFTPFGPHDPYTPAPRHEHVYDDALVPLPPNFNRRSPDTHPWWKRQKKWDEERIREIARSQYETLLSEDEALERFYATLTAQGELDNTIIVFLTDNGYSLGSHRWLRKHCAWEECEHIPLMIRAPGLDTVGETGALVSNVDLAKTISDLAGLDFGGDGMSLVPLMTGEADSLGRPALLRVVRNLDQPFPRDDAPTTWGLRTHRWKYLRYSSRERDLYDLKADPYELEDLAGRKRYQGIVQDLNAQMEDLRDG